MVHGMEGVRIRPRDTRTVATCTQTVMHWVPMLHAALYMYAFKRMGHTSELHVCDARAAEHRMSSTSAQL